IAFVATGLVVGTLATSGTLLWYYVGGKEPSDAPKSGFVTLAPMLSPTERGLAIMGSF
ncbi:MAG: hypothetical protein FJ095_05395, partial [Deltaproteobacteria bacterium]|nr:hypothetical protein [Deltaproteobacteria bacterium]